MDKRVLFLCKKRVDSYGKPIGLFNSAKFMANALNAQGIESKLETVIDGNGIDKAVTEYKPSHVIIEAFWATPAKMEELLKIQRHTKTQWIVRCHSKTPFLANEGMAFEWMSGYAELAQKYNNFYLSGNNKEFVKEVNKSLKWGMVYLPNIYFPEKCPYQYVCGYEGGGCDCTCEYDFDARMKYNRSLHIGCFGAMRPMKNHVIQALAAIELANRKDRKLFFHINASRVEQKGESTLKNLRAIFASTEHELVEHKWLDHKQFVRLVSKMDICMQVSFSESFNIVTADAVDNNVPVVVGEDVSWIPKCFRSDPTDICDIIKKLNRVYHIGFLRMIAVHWNKWALQIYNWNAKCIWLNFLHNTLDLDWEI